MISSVGAMVAMAAGILFMGARLARPRTVALSVCVYSYLDRPIFEILVDGKVDEVSGAYPETGGGTITGVRFKLGPKRVTWRLSGPPGAPRNGETVESANQVALDDIVPGARYLAVHIYPDDTVELLTSVQRPRASPRGEKEIARMKAERRE